MGAFPSFYFHEGITDGLTPSPLSITDHPTQYRLLKLARTWTPLDWESHGLFILHSNVWGGHCYVKLSCFPLCYWPGCSAPRCVPGLRGSVSPVLSHTPGALRSVLLPRFILPSPSPAVSTRPVSTSASPSFPADRFTAVCLACFHVLATVYSAPVNLGV